jgi:hypothetical protein
MRQMEYDPKKVRELEGQVQKQTMLMYKYKSWVFKKQDAIIKIADDLQLEKAKQDTITT